MNQRSIDVGGLELVIAEAGRGGRPLLLVHGFGGAKEDFTGWLDQCGALGWHAVAPDLRGHGASAHPPEEADYSLGIMAADLIGLIDALGWERVTLLGHSMGGMVAQLIALDHPERLDGLILMDTSHRCPDSIHPEPIEAGQGIVRQGGVELLVQIQAAMGPDPLATPAYQHKVATDPGYEQFCRDKTLAMSSACWAAVAGEIIDQPDRLDALSAVAVPTLVIVGAQDAGFLPQSEAMAKVIPGAQLAVIPGGGHSPQFEAPDAWWAALSGFLAECAAALT